MRMSYEKLILKYKVDIMFFGHVHAYERNNPVADFQVGLAALSDRISHGLHGEVAELKGVRISASGITGKSNARLNATLAPGGGGRQICLVSSSFLAGVQTEAAAVINCLPLPVYKPLCMQSSAPLITTHGTCLNTRHLV